MSVSEFVYSEIQRELDRDCVKIRFPRINKIIEWVNVHCDEYKTQTFGWMGGWYEKGDDNFEYKPDVEIVCIEGIDRGVMDWVEFAHTLGRNYPNLKILVFEQNWSEFKGTEDERIAHFQYFVNHLALDFLYFNDCSTPYLHEYRFLRKLSCLCIDREGGPIIFENTESVNFSTKVRV